jgi:replicative superfamily II helicase
VTVTDNQLKKIRELSSHVIKQGVQVLVFVRSRSISQQYAKSLADVVDPWLTTHEREELRDAAKSITEFRVAGGPGYLGIMGDLPPLLHKGVSFYHTGLLYGIREIIEDEFKKRSVKLVCCTTAPGSSVTTPARIVILTDTMYFRPGPKGRRTLERMDNNTVHQILGRTGQIDFDSQAFGIVMAKDNDERTRLINEYFIIKEEGSLEAKFNPIRSGLDDNKQLARQVMLEAFDHDGVTQDHLNEFFKKTFYTHQHKGEPRGLDPIINSLSFTIEDVLRSRSRPNIYQKAIENKAKVKINSATKNRIEGSVQSSSKPDSWHISTFDETQGPTCDCKYYRFRGRRDGVLCRHLIRLGTYCSKSSKYHGYAENIIPKLLNGESLAKQMIQEGFLNIEDEKLYCTRLGILTVKMLLEPQVVSFIRDAILKQAIKNNQDTLTLITNSMEKSQIYTLNMRNIDILSNVVKDWINEVSIVEIARRYKIYPNDIFSMINNSSKLARSISGIAKIQNKKNLEKSTKILAQQIRWGVKEELLDIMNTSAPGLNRGVSRQLFDAGYKTINQLSKASIDDISAKTKLSKGRLTRILKYLKSDPV